jgi:PIN domain nuclease of toxin-antitoxin system
MNPTPLLDTHAWIWWLHANPSLPTATAKRLDALSESGHKPHLSDISLWEAQMLFAKGCIVRELSFPDWLIQATRSVNLVRISPKVIQQVHLLPKIFHGDPADRLIVATALANHLPMVTLDRKIRTSGLVDIWE